LIVQATTSKINVGKSGSKGQNHSQSRLKAENIQSFTVNKNQIDFRKNTTSTAGQKA